MLLDAIGLHVSNAYKIFPFFGTFETESFVNLAGIFVVLPAEIFTQNFAKI